MCMYVFSTEMANTAAHMIHQKRIPSLITYHQHAFKGKCRLQPSTNKPPPLPQGGMLQPGSTIPPNNPGAGMPQSPLMSPAGQQQGSSTPFRSPLPAHSPSIRSSKSADGPGGGPGGNPMAPIKSEPGNFPGLSPSSNRLPQADTTGGDGTPNLPGNTTPNPAAGQPSPSFPSVSY